MKDERQKNQKNKGLNKSTPQQINKQSGQLPIAIVDSSRILSGQRFIFTLNSLLFTRLIARTLLLPSFGGVGGGFGGWKRECGFGTRMTLILLEHG